MGKLLEFFKSFGRSPAPAPTPGRKTASAHEASIDEEAFDFFNALSGTLEIEFFSYAELDRVVQALRK